MESIKYNREWTKYLIIENVINKYLKESFGKDWETIKCDTYLLESIIRYLNNNWNQKIEDLHKIHERILNYISIKESNDFDKNFEKFINLINDHSDKNWELLHFLQTNNVNEIQHKTNTDITDNFLWNEQYYLLYSFLLNTKKNWESLNDFIHFEKNFIKDTENWWNTLQDNTKRQTIALSIDNFNETKEWPEEIIPLAKTLIEQNISFDIFVEKINEFLQAWRLF